MNIRVRVILPWIVLSLLLLLQVDQVPVGAVNRQSVAAPAEAPARSGIAAQDGVTTTLTYLPIFLKPECGFYNAQLTLTPSQRVVQVGEVITVTATLTNRGCGSLGLPQYRVGVGPFGQEPALELLDPEPIVHYLGIGPEGSDSAQFALRAIRAGQAEVTANVSFEFHAGYPGPAFWGSAAADPLTITVESEMATTPTPTTASPGTVTPSATARVTHTPTPTLPGTLPSLGVYKRAAPSVVQAGDVLTYTVVMMNDMLGGADPGATVLLTDTLPAYTTYVTGSATSGAVYDAANDRITWAGAIPQGLHQLVSFAVRIDQDAPETGTIENIALVRDALGLVREARATVSLGSATTETPTPTPTITPMAGALGLQKLVEPGVVAPGEVLTYTILVMNDMLGGPDPGASVVLTDAIPLYTSYVEGSLTGGAQYDATANRVTWTGAISRGGSVALTFQVRVDAKAEPDRVANVVELRDALGGAMRAIAVASVIQEGGTPTPTPTGTVYPPTPTVTPAGPTLMTHKMAEPGVVGPGDVISYTIIIMNDQLGGGDPGASVAVTDRIPAFTTYITDTISQGGWYDAALNAIAWSGAIPQGGNAQVSFAVRVEAEAGLGSAIDNVALVEDAFGRVAAVRASVAVR